MAAPAGAADHSLAISAIRVRFPEFRD